MDNKRFNLISAISLAVMCGMFMACGALLGDFFWYILGAASAVLAVIFAVVVWKNAKSGISKVQENIEKSMYDLGLKCEIINGSQCTLGIDSINKKFCLGVDAQVGVVTEVLNYRSFGEVACLVNNKVIAIDVLEKIPDGIDIVSVELRINFKENIKTIKIPYINKTLKSQSKPCKKSFCQLKNDAQMLIDNFK